MRFKLLLRNCNGLAVVVYKSMIVVVVVVMVVHMIDIWK
jgi:hypothetical protein